MSKHSRGAQAPVVLSQEASLRGKLRRLALFPMHSLTAKLGLAQALHAGRIRREGERMRKLGLDQLLKDKDSAAMDQDPADLMFLSDTIRQRRPKRIIEFGSGQSTMFIADALSRNGEGHLHSLDADARWLEHTAKMLPSHLRPYVTFVHSPVVVNTDHGVAAYQYTVIPEGRWDFILVDGPACNDDVRLSCDLVHLADALNSGGGGMIDHRWRTAVLARELVSDKIRIRYKPTLESFVFERAH
jgi:predicted O-methyltransferase YrrM